jgi:hypothetical protein
VATIGFGLAAGFRVDAGRDTGCKRQMRLSRLGTDSSLPPDYQGFRDSVRVGPIDPRGGSAEQLAAHQPIGVVRRPFREPPLTAESGGATRAALLAMRAHRGTGSSNPLPSSGSSRAAYVHPLQTAGAGWLRRCRLHRRRRLSQLAHRGACHRPGMWRAPAANPISALKGLESRFIKDLAVF